MNPTEMRDFQEWVAGGCVTFSAVEHDDYQAWENACKADEINDRIMTQATWGGGPIVLY